MASSDGYVPRTTSNEIKPRSLLSSSSSSRCSKSLRSRVLASLQAARTASSFPSRLSFCARLTSPPQSTPKQSARKDDGDNFAPRLFVHHEERRWETKESKVKDRGKKREEGRGRRKSCRASIETTRENSQVRS